MSDNEKTLALLAALAGVRTSGPRKVQRPRMGDEIRRLRDENGALRAEIDRLRSERNEYRARFYAVVSLVPADMLAGTLQDARDEYLKTRRILAALREPSHAVIEVAALRLDSGNQEEALWAIRAAVAAAEQEAQGE